MWPGSAGLLPDGRRAGSAPKGLVYRHGRPREEPLLWVADALVGALGTEASGSGSTFSDILPATLCEIHWLAGP